MAKYFPVSPNIWNRDFRNVGQKSLEALVVYLYLITCRPRGTEGLYSLHKGYISADTGLVADAVDRALDVLIEAGYISYDTENDVILDRHALRYYSPGAGFQTKGATNRIEQVPDSPLKRDLLDLALQFAPDFAAKILDSFPYLKDSSRTPQGGLDTASRARARARAEHREEKEQELVVEKSSDFGSDSDFDSQASKISASAHTQNGLPPGWTFLEGPEECAVCHSGCTQLDPEGVVQHYGCVEGGF